MRIFDTSVQKLKYLVLKALIKNEYEHCYDNVYIDIPKEISPGPKAEMRCCIYKERAIVQERIKLALGGNKNNPNVVEVIDIACDECPIGGVFVTPSCRGCIVHRCKEACPKDAIQIIDRKAVIDKSKCIECGKCTQACPVQRHHRAKAAVRHFLQGQGDQRGRKQKGAHRQRQVHFLRRVRLSMPLRRHRR